jgi:hypothetical protein
MLTSPDDITRKLMKQFEFEQARNCGIEYKKRQHDCTSGFLNWNPPFDQIYVNPDVHTQTILPPAFNAHQEDQISFWVHNGEQFLTHGVVEPFVESKPSNQEMRITQSVRHQLYRKRFRDRQVIASADVEPESIAVSNNMFSWATSRSEDRMVRFTLRAHLDALASPQKINYWNHGRTQSRCPFCGMIAPSIRHIQCMCNKPGTNSLVRCAVGDAASAVHKKPFMKINENKAIHHVCQRMDQRLRSSNAQALFTK